MIKSSLKINKDMHKLLIDIGMDGFSVTEAKDAIIEIEAVGHKPLEVRKKIYGSIYRFCRNGWLRSEGKGHKKRYFQTDKFKSHIHKIKEANPRKELFDSSVLSKELVSHWSDLEIALGEVRECSKLALRFPELSPSLLSLQQQARNRAIVLAGKINVLTKVLNLHSQKEM